LCREVRTDFCRSTGIVMVKGIGRGCLPGDWWAGKHVGKANWRLDEIIHKSRTRQILIPFRILNKFVRNINLFGKWQTTRDITFYVRQVAICLLRLLCLSALNIGFLNKRMAFASLCFREEVSIRSLLLLLIWDRLILTELKSGHERWAHESDLRLQTNSFWSSLQQNMFGWEREWSGLDMDWRKGGPLGYGVRVYKVGSQGPQGWQHHKSSCWNIRY
jgi:hypothetical protein